MNKGLPTHSLSSLAFTLVIVFIFASCQPVHQLGKTPRPEKPFIALRSGDTVYAGQVYEEMGFQGSRIVADTTAYPRRAVEAFSDGNQTFHQLSRGTFGPWIAQGKVNVYSSTNATRYGYPEHDERLSKLYVQSGSSGSLKTINYRNLRVMMPESPSLLQFRRTRRVIDAVLLAGACGFFAGAIIGGDATLKSNNSVADKGATLMFGSMGLIATASVSLSVNRVKLRRAISIHNGVLKQ